MRPVTYVTLFALALITLTGCTRTTEEVTIERHQVDTEFIVE